MPGGHVKPQVVLFDLDGTLADITHRVPLVRGHRKNWRAFFRACVDDKPNLPVIASLHALRAAGHHIWIISGRSDEVRSDTEVWLGQHGVNYERLIMRRAGDYTADDVLKRSWLHTWLQNGELRKDDILCVFDDRDKVVRMWREEGLHCFQVAPGDF